LPLSGLRVVDLTRILAGPFCSMILGDKAVYGYHLSQFQGDDPHTLAADILALMRKERIDRIWYSDLASKLMEGGQRTWLRYSGNKSRLASVLQSIGIKHKPIRIYGVVNNGYEITQLEAKMSDRT
jgi:CoA-transferase family III